MSDVAYASTAALRHYGMGMPAEAFGFKHLTPSIDVTCGLRIHRRLAPYRIEAFGFVHSLTR